MIRVAFASKVCRNLFYPRHLPVGRKFDPTHCQPGGPAATTPFILRKLGSEVDQFGWYTADDEPLQRCLNAAGITSYMDLLDGPGAVNIVLDGPRVLRAIPGPTCTPPRQEAGYLAEFRPSAIAFSGSFPAVSAEFWVTSAAALGIPCFWDASPKANLDVASSGGEVYLQVSDVEFAALHEGLPSALLARALLAKTGAAGVFVTAAKKGAFGVLRGDPTVLHAPAIPVADPVQEVGAGDAHFAGLIMAILQAPRANRLDRALAVGRLVAARHVSGLDPAGWHDLRLFEEKLGKAPALRVAA